MNSFFTVSIYLAAHTKKGVKEPHLREFFDTFVALVLFCFLQTFDSSVPYLCIIVYDFFRVVKCFFTTILYPPKSENCGKLSFSYLNLIFSKKDLTNQKLSVYYEP